MLIIRYVYTSVPLMGLKLGMQTPEHKIMGMVKSKVQLVRISILSLCMPATHKFSVSYIQNSCVTDKDLCG